jgi:IstB-like ATP binding protein
MTLAERTLDLALGFGPVWVAGLGLEAVMPGKIDERAIVGDAASSPARSAISLILTLSCIIGSTPLPTRACTPLHNASSTKHSLRRSPTSRSCRSRHSERRVSHEGMVSVGGNLYSVPDATRKRIVEVHTLANEVQIFEDGTLIANHPVLEGRRQRRIAPGHRKLPRITHRRCDEPIVIVRAGDTVATRPLDFYQRAAVSATLEIVPSVLDRIRKTLVGLKMPRALEVLDQYRATIADIVSVLAKAEREGQLRDRIRFLCRPSLLIVDEIGYLPVIQGGGNLFFQLVNARYERGAMILTSNRGFAEWGEVFGDPVVATVLLDRLLHHAVVIQIEGSSYRSRQNADLMPEHVRSKALISSPIPAQPPRRRGRPPNNGASDHGTG